MEPAKNPAPLVELFQQVLDETPEGGAMFSAWRGNDALVDLWGGFAAPGKPWSQDSLEVLWSGTKGLVAACLIKLVETGQLSLDAPISRYWPAFGQAGKSRLSVGQALSHSDGITGISTRNLPLGDIVDDEAMEELVAREPLPDDARCFGAYHPLTYGWICGGLLRRIDGRKIGAFFRDEFGRPLELDLWIGLPPEHEARVGQLSFSSRWRAERAPGPGEDGFDPFVWRTWANPNLFEPDMPWNSRAFHAASIPGAGAIGTARGMSRFYAMLANGGELEGTKVLQPESIVNARQVLADFTDPLVGRRFRIGAGFWMQTEEMLFGPEQSAFGHPGAGVSVHGAWPDRGVGFSFVPNVMLNDADDTRAPRLLQALHAWLSK